MPAYSTPLLVAVLAAGAVAHGAATHRWQALAPDRTAADRLHAHAVGYADFAAEVVPSDFDVNENSRVTCRRYVSAAHRAGAVVSVTTGPPGAVATHTPDVCYPGSGYKPLTPVRVAGVPLAGGQVARFYVCDFEKVSASRADRQRVRWAWAAAGGRWDAPPRPRFAYLAEPGLAKLYVVTGVPDAPPGGDGEPADPPAVAGFVAAAFAQYADLAAGR